MIKTTTMRLPEQTVTTLDGVALVVKAIVKYEISDPAKMLLEVNDAVDAVADMAQAIIREHIIIRKHEDCNNVEFGNEITKKVRTEARRWGVAVDTVTLTDFGKMISVRLLNTNTTVAD